MKIPRSSLCSAVALSAALSATAAAQPGPSGDVRREFETRAELETQAKAAEAAHRNSEAFLLKTRLERGDFQEGDRIIVVLPNVGPQADTMVVREGRIVQLPRMADFRLEGVLRSELNERLTEHLGKYLKDPTVRATPLLRLAVLGEVRNPGFFYGPADVLLTDVIMKAGGPTGTADWDNVIIKRGSDVIWTGQDVRTAMTDGMSLDRLHLRAGDEIVVGRRRDVSWNTFLQIGSGVLFLATALITFARR